MNQINLDSLLSSSAKSAQSLVTLVQHQSYQALLSIGKEGLGTLTIPQTGSAPLQLSSPQLNLPQWQGPLSVQLSQHSSGQLQLQLSQHFVEPQPVQLSQQQWQQLVKSLNQQQNNAAVTLPVQVQVQHKGSQKELVLQLPNASAAPLRMPLPASLAPLPAAVWHSANLQYQQGELKLQLQVPASSSEPRPEQPPRQTTTPAPQTPSPVLARSARPDQLPLKVEAQHQINLTLAAQTEREDQTVTLGGGRQQNQASAGSDVKNSTGKTGQQALSAPAPITAATQKTVTKTLLLPAALQQQLLPLFSQKISQQLQQTLLPLAQLQQLPLPQQTRQQLAAPAYQLQLSSQGQLQLKAPLQQQAVLIDPQPKGLQLQPSAKPEQISQPAAVATNQTKAALTSEVGQTELPSERATKPTHSAPVAPPIRLDATTLSQAWRQLLPLVPDQWQELAETPELPAAVKEILQQIRLPQPDPLKPQLARELPQQLQALLQFNPLQLATAATTTNTAANGLAVALQLLLGRVSNTSAPQEKTAPVSNKLKELVQQLDPQQSQDLLKKLSSQSASLQQAQLATVEQQSKEPLQQLYFALPLNGQQQTDLCQIAISEREPEQKKGRGQGSSWQLTMKFDLKILGNLLAISQLNGNQLSLQLYTDNNTALLMAEKFMPLLRDRLNAQGLQLTETRCQLGKIPDSLLPRTTSLLAIRV